MHRNAIYFCVMTENIAQGMMEGKVVDGITAVEQGAINIEEAGVCCIPAKTSARVGTRRGCPLVLRS